jgi:hypothetical protein
MVYGRLPSLGGVVAAVLLGAAAPAVAQPMLQNIIPFDDNRVAQSPPVARYVGVEGQSFIFSRGSGSQALLKFDDDPEVWVLAPSPAPRGDVVYRNDAGEPVLRVTRLGGLTLFTSQEPEGLPVAMLGEAEDLAPPPVMGQGALLSRLAQASYRVGRAISHPVTFYAASVSPQSAPLFADAATIAADALVRIARRPEARAFLAKLDKVTFLAGLKADVAIKGALMEIMVVPGHGFAGRPSSDRLVRAILKR